MPNEYVLKVIKLKEIINGLYVYMSKESFGKLEESSKKIFVNGAHHCIATKTDGNILLSE